MLVYKEWRPVNRWLAVVLGLLVPAVGLLYLGRLGAALVALGIRLLGAATLWFLPLDGQALPLPLALQTLAAVVVLAILLPFAMVVVALVPVWRSRSAPVVRGRNRFVLLILLSLSVLPGWFTRPVETFDIASGSMLPAMVPGDHFFAERPHHAAYRPVTPGELLVYSLPRDPREKYVKRLIGLPGDRVQMREGRLWLNGELVAREPLGPFTLATGGPAITVQRYRETLPGGTSYHILEVSDRQNGDNTPEFIVPPDHYFFMGDNRDNSLDSRYQMQVGFIPAEHVLGRAVAVFWQRDLSRIGTILNRPAP